MLKPALVVAMLSLLLLALLIQFLPPSQVKIPSDLAPLLANQKLSVSGVVIAERSFSSEKRLTLASGIEVRCSCPRSSPLKNKRISVVGVLQHYQNKTWIEAHGVEIQP